MVVRELIAVLGFEVKDDDLNKFDNKLKNIGQGMKDFGRKGTLMVSLPLLALGGIFVKTASDAEEVQNKFDTVFRDIGDRANKTAHTLGDAFGIGSDGARRFLGDTGDLLTGFGFTQDSALDLARRTNELAVDLASFTNVQGGATRASKALTKALLGERESVKELGISILEEDVKRKVQEMRARGITFETERQAKAYATLELAIQQSKNAIGDFQRTQSSFANRLRRFFVLLKDTSIAFGKILLPAVNAVLGVMLKFAKLILNLPRGVKIVILAIGGLLVVLFPLLNIAGSLLTTWSLLNLALISSGTSFGILAGSIWATVAPLALLVAKIALLAGAIFLLYDDIATWRRGGRSITGILLGPWIEWRDNLKSLISDVAKFWDDLINFRIFDTLENLKLFGKTVRAFFGADLTQEAIDRSLAPARRVELAGNSGILGGSIRVSSGDVNVNVGGTNASAEEIGSAVRGAVNDALISTSKDIRRNNSPSEE